MRGLVHHALDTFANDSAGSGSGSELIAKSHLDGFAQIMGDFINAIGQKLMSYRFECASGCEN
jgi:hypothetical protein